MPIAPGALVQVQAIGLLAWYDASETRHVVVARPKADRGTVGIQHWRDLTEDQRRALEAGIGREHRLEWQAPFQAVQVIRNARRMARLVQVDSGQKSWHIWRRSCQAGVMGLSCGWRDRRPPRPRPPN